MGCNGCTIDNESDRPAMLSTHDWLKDLPDTTHLSNIVEVRFKGTHKEFFRNEEHLSLKVGDLVVVACTPGHDVGHVTLTGTLEKKHFDRKKKNTTGIPGTRFTGKQLMPTRKNGKKHANANMPSWCARARLQPNSDWK